MHVKVITHFKMEQSLKTRCIINDEFHKLELMWVRVVSAHTDASKTKGIDPDASKT